MHSTLRRVAFTLLAAGTLLAIASSARTGPVPREVGPAPQCGSGGLALVVTCIDAQMSVSLGMAVTDVHIWLTTLAAVDERLAPRRQVADHPADPETAVWLFVYDGYRPPIQHQNEAGQLVQSLPETRVLHVADATNPKTKVGGFVYIYGWSELGSPELPTTMPIIAAAP